MFTTDAIALMAPIGSFPNNFGIPLSVSTTLFAPSKKPFQISSMPIVV